MINKGQIKRITNKQDDNNKFVTLQFTLFDSTGKYKPISTLVKVQSVKWFKENQEEVKTKAIQQICNQRRLTGKELVRLGYTKMKIRNYDLYLARREQKRLDKQEEK